MGKSRSRHLERSRAFQVLYASYFNELDTVEDLRQLFVATPTDDKLDPDPERSFAWELVYGTWKNAQQIDSLIEKHSHNWRVDRIGKVELTLLRLAMYELVFYSDTPTRVVINEALELITRFGDAKSKSFINGILDAAAKECEEHKTEKTHE